MSAPVRLAAYVAVLAVVLLTAFAVGNAVGPIGTSTSEEHGATTDSSVVGHD